MQTNRLAPFLLLFLLSAGTCGPGSMKTEETLSQIQREVTVGMPRAEVEKLLARTPGIADVVYTPRERIQPTEERTFGGTPLSGRMTVSTPLEIDGLGKASGHVVIEFDQQDRVVNLRVGGFGIRK